jgi:UDP-GlcNAc:undecaprenyl-phosphate/decaprenyl-phosphate GlcNAc-1-phosphate transferase
VSSLAALAAFPVTACVLPLLLRSPLAVRLRAAPEASRWRTHATPLVGGIAIYAGISAGIWLAVAVGELNGSEQLLGLFAGATLLFVAGLVDDLWSLSARWKLAAQIAGAVIVLSTGTTVQMIHAQWIAIPLGLFWIVGMTNAFNLLDNMDGLAASLAVIAAIFFAAAATWYQPSRLVLVMSVALAFALLAFLPFNLRPGRRALAWMGDSGSLLIGFMLASLGLASSYTVASSTLATLLLPVIVLAVPILDTTLVTIVRLLDGRPVTQGGRDHSSHRLVALGVSETSAVILLAAVSAALGATSLAYEAFGNGRVAAIGVLITFVLIVQFGSFLADVDRGDLARRRPLVVYTRRMVEVLIDGALIAASFLAAYLLRFDGIGTINQRQYFLIALPMLLFCRYVVFVPLGLYAGVGRYAGSRDALRAAMAVCIGSVLAVGLLVLTQQPAGDFSRDVFVIDAFICTAAIIGARFAERAIGRAFELAHHREARKVLIVGAGKSGRSLLRELRETSGERVVAFVDDDARLIGRRLGGVKVFGSIRSLGAAVERVHPDAVLVTIPDAPRDALDEIVSTCARLDVTCRFVQRNADLDPTAVLRASR